MGHFNYCWERGSFGWVSSSVSGCFHHSWILLGLKIEDDFEGEMNFVVCRNDPNGVRRS